MNYFRLPRWVIAKIDKVRRIFLWDRNEGNGYILDKFGDSLPKEWEGLGLKNVKFQNIALLFRWWWRLHQQQGSHWKFWTVRLRAGGDSDEWSGTPYLVKTRIILLVSIAENWKAFQVVVHRLEYQWWYILVILVQQMATGSDKMARRWSA